VLSIDSTVRDAIACLNQSALQIVLVTDSEDQLVGTLTDGDIRRGLLRGLGLDSPVDNVTQRTPIVVPPSVPADVAIGVMRANRIRQLPIVDESRHVVGMHLWDEVTAVLQRPNLMVIMAGGRGTRLRPHTENCPKPLLPVGDKPMLEHIIVRAQREGFCRFVIAVHYLGHMIEDYFGDGSRWQVRIDYVREPTPLGTAGAIGLLAPPPADAFLVTNGDVLTDINYGDILDFHQRYAAVGTMAVRQHEWRHPFGTVRIDGFDIVGFEEKPVTVTQINAGIYVLDSKAIGLLGPNEHCDMPALFARVKQAGGRTVAYPMHEPWLDVGRPDDYLSAQRRDRGDR
jgi:dTDP-glucose pyrophosphorylase